MHASLLTAFVAALAGPAPASPAAVEHFEAKVRPVLVDHCLGCHGAGGKVKGGLDLTTAAGRKAGGDSGPAIVPGQPEKSLFIEVLSHDGDVKMPPKGKLKPAEVAALAAWVKAGAPWPDVAASAEVAKGGPLFTAEQKQFWAFQPVREVVPPATRGAAETPIDRFLLARLEERGQTFAPPADRRTLIRRVTFDLIGLPPTPEEIAAFLADDSPAAFARVVDRLLASPHYGERWGRHWLDVARYADSNGLDENTLFGNAWRYRDWVIQAVNDDKPFADFVAEQLAGDLLPATGDAAKDLARRTATGYLAIGPKLLAEPDKQKMLLDIADEQLDVVSKGLMGLTVACARCHDHKFDPIPTRDYYSLLGVFTSTRTMQSLGTVAKAYEHSAGPADPRQKQHAALRAATQKRLQGAEQRFGKTPESDKTGRLRIHHEAEGYRRTLRWLAVLATPPAQALGVAEGSAGAYGTAPRNLYVQARGSYATPREEAPPVFPRILAGEDAPPFVATTPNPDDKPAANQTRFGAKRAASGRLELARWLADPKHPLTGRVFVNRVWAKHFGEGLVRSVDNFGRLGERPTHPELLDWLAAEFWRRGGSPKALHRTMLLTRAYQQSATPADPAVKTLDPDNRLLAHFPRRRLDAEPLRDGMLAVAGTLDRARGGSLYGGANFEYVGDADYGPPRRSVYLPVFRSKLFDYFQTFDFPDPATPAGQRVNTTVAPQALFLMNSPFVATQAAAFAARAAQLEPDEAQRAGRMLELAYGRTPRPGEAARARKFARDYGAAAGDPGRGWAALGQALLASSEFLTVE